MTTMTGTLLDAALAWQAAGACVVRTRSDGTEQSKAPLGNWKQYQAAAPGAGTLAAWFGNGSGHAGMGIVCGAVSGNLDMFELEGRAIAEGYLDALLAVLAQRGLASLWTRITSGYTEQTPSGGIHVLYRLSDGPVPGNTPLARRPETAAEMDAREMTEAERRRGAKKPRPVVLIETRGEGGFTVVAPSGGRTHPTGRPWVRLLGRPATAAVITTAEREMLCDAARSLDEMPARGVLGVPGTGTAEPSRPGQISGQPEDPVRAVSPPPREVHGMSWEAILVPHGWSYVGTDERGELWARPGKDPREGHSATTREDHGLYVFSSSTDFETEASYSKAAAWAVLNDGADPGEALATWGTAQESAVAADAAWLASVGTSAGELAARDAGKPLDGARDPGRPRFDVTSRAVAADVLRATLGNGRLAGLYLRDGMLVHTPRTGEDGYIEPTPREKARGVDHGPAQVRPVDDRHVRSLCDVAYEVGHQVKRGAGDPEWARTLFPADVAASAIGAAELGIGCPNLEHLAGVTHTPLIREDGTLLTEPGYDRATGLLYLPTGGLALPPVPERPSRAEIAAALELLARPVAQFPFVAPHHLANYLGAMLTPALRLLLEPPYQLAVITATNPGSGKTLLMRMLGAVHGITTRGEFPRDRDELRKLFLSTLMTTTAPVIGMDNLRGTIYSSELEALLTARVLTDRVLGTNRIATVTNDRLWVATGNNARIGGDLARRCLPVALDPGCADPHKRTGFALSPVPWMHQHRGEYLAALLTLARGWIQAGVPMTTTRSDDYSLWESALRGLLGWAGLEWGGEPAVFGAEDEDFAVTEDDDEWAAFVWALTQVYGIEVKFTAKQVADQVATAGIMPHVPESGTLRDALPGDLAERTGRPGFAKSLSKWLAYRDGRVTRDGLTVRIHRDDVGSKIATFRVHRIHQQI